MPKTKFAEKDNVRSDMKYECKWLKQTSLLINVTFKCFFIETKFHSINFQDFELDSPKEREGKEVKRDYYFFKYLIY